jgi:hypothetical protein
MFTIFFLFYGQFETYFMEIQALFLEIHNFRRPDFGQTIWDKNVVLFGTHWVTFLELDGNPLETHWGQQKNPPSHE